MLRSFSSRPLYQRSLRRLIYLYRRSVWLSLRQRVSVFIFILVAVDVLVGHFFHPIIFEIPTLAKILPLSAACLLEPRPTLGIEQQQPRSSTAPHVVSAFDSGQNHRELLRVVFTELSSRPPH